MTGAIILAIGGWLSFAGMTAVASVLGIILRVREEQIAHLKTRLHETKAELDKRWEAR